MVHCTVSLHIHHQYQSAVLFRQRVFMQVLEVLHHALHRGSVSAEHQPEDSLQVVGVLQAHITTQMRLHVRGISFKVAAATTTYDALPGCRWLELESV